MDKLLISTYWYAAYPLGVVFPQVFYLYRQAGTSEALLAHNSHVSAELQLSSESLSLHKPVVMGSVRLDLFFLGNWVFKGTRNVPAAASSFHVHAAFIALRVTSAAGCKSKENSPQLSPSPWKLCLSLVSWVHSVYHGHEKNWASVSLPAACPSLRASPVSWGCRDEASSDVVSFSLLV